MIHPERTQVILAPDQLRYNPCGDIIFPTILDAQKALPRPLGRYYMYYAPHNSPGGICLAHAPSPAGPWTEYEGNPVIARDWPPHYHVGHVSSPHALFVPETGLLHMYYHGDNDTTRLATSRDGLAFEYAGTAIDSSRFPNPQGAFYARVFEHPASSPRARYVMLLPGRTANEVGILSAVSPDARSWTLQPGTVIDVRGLADVSTLCSAYLFALQGRHFIAFHADWGHYAIPGGPVTDLWVVEVGRDLAPLGGPRVLLRHGDVGEGNRRVSDPVVFVEGDAAWLLFTTGARLHQDIALIETTVAELLDAIDHAPRAADAYGPPPEP